MDTQFSNQSLKTELCGRIQQLQLMSKGMASAGDKMYQRVLHEMEQNSMKAYVRRHPCPESSNFRTVAFFDVDSRSTPPIKRTSQCAHVPCADR